MIKYRTDLFQVIDTKMPAAEVGVANGIFSEVIRSWGVPILYLVDTWAFTGIPGDGFQPQEWHDKNLNEVFQKFGHDQNMILLQGLSIVMADTIENESLGFVYLDACHLEECVIEDLLAWYPKLKYGGIMAGHDIALEGVKKAVTAFTKGLKIKYEIVPEESDELASFYFRKA